jgi:hypothetical protein
MTTARGGQPGEHPELGRTGARARPGGPRYLSRGAAVTAVGSAGLARTFILDIGNLTSGPHHTGFAVPIDTAPAVAKRIQAAHSR